MIDGIFIVSFIIISLLVALICYIGTVIRKEHVKELNTVIKTQDAIISKQKNIIDALRKEQSDYDSRVR
jgi:Na+-transporting methylmalonyl-CoA/oxaloacetate decarboxylase gamma subunit